MVLFLGSIENINFVSQLSFFKSDTVIILFILRSGGFYAASLCVIAYALI